MILTVFTRDRRTDWALEEIANGTGLPKSTTHRLLDTLVQEGFVELGQRPGTYRLGLQAAVVGSAAIRIRRPDQDVHQLLRKAVEQVHETIGLTVRDGRRVVVIDKVSSPRPLHWRNHVGDEISAHQSAAGKVLLATLSDDEVRELYAGVDRLPRTTPNTVGSVDELIASLEPVRRDGYAVDAEELELGLRCVSVPVRTVSGQTVLALTMSAPASRLAPDALEGPVRALMRIAREISPHLELEGAE